MVAIDQVPAEIPLVLELCRQAKEISKGWFDPWAMPDGVDPTGLVKGWAIQQALEVLQGAGVEAAMVNGGGDIALHGQHPGAGSWRVGVRHPWRADALACVLEVCSAVATSGCYERGPAPGQSLERDRRHVHCLGYRDRRVPDNRRCARHRRRCRRRWSVRDNQIDGRLRGVPDPGRTGPKRLPPGSCSPENRRQVLERANPTQRSSPHRNQNGFM